MVDRYTRLKRFLHREIWHVDPETLPRLKRSLLGMVRLLLVLGFELTEGQLALQATSLVYTTLLSLVPLLAVSFSVLKGFGVHNELEPLLMQFLAPLGDKGVEVSNRILEFVNNMDVRVLGYVGLGMLVYTIFSLMQKIESAFNYVWHVRKARSIGRRFTDFFAVTTIGPLLVFSGIGSTATFLHSQFVQQILAFEPFGSVMVVLSLFAPTALIIAAFTFFYVFVPNTRIHFSSALVGALIAGILWQATGLLFASFAASSTQYAAIYSGFAILILFMTWLYLSWFILLFGAQVAYFHQNPEQIRLERERFALSARLKERVGLVVAYLVTDAYHRGGPFWTLDRLVHRLAIPADAIQIAIDALVRRRLLIETADDPCAYVPGRDPDQIRVTELLDALRSAEEAHHLVSESRLHVRTVDAIVSRMEAARAANLNDLRLEDLVRERETKTHLPDADRLH